MWFPLALFYATFNTVSNVAVKKLTQKIHPLHVIALLLGVTGISMFGILLFTGGIPNTSLSIYKYMAVSAILDTIAFIAAFYALRDYPISLVVPVSSFSPVFTMIFGILFLHETPTPFKFLAILLVVIGVYILNISNDNHGYLKPIQKLATNRGIQLFFFANLIWSITPIIQKKAISFTHPQSPLFPAMIGMVLITFLMVLLSIFIGKKPFEAKEIKRHSPLIIFIGIFGALGQLAAYTVFTLTQVAYAISVFRLSTLFTIVAGGIFFKEKDLLTRFLGAAIMVIGAILIAI